MRVCGVAEITFLATEGFALVLGLPNVLFVRWVFIYLSFFWCLLTDLAMSSAGFLALRFQTAMSFILTHYFQFYHSRLHCL